MTGDKTLTVTIGGKAVDLTKPTVRARARLLQQAWAWRKARHADNLRLKGLSDDDVLTALERFDWEQRPTDSLLIRWAAEEDGQLALLDDAYGDDCEWLFADTTPDERFDIICDLWGWERAEGADPTPPASQNQATPAQTIPSDSATAA